MKLDLDDRAALDALTTAVHMLVNNNEEVRCARDTAFTSFLDAFNSIQQGKLDHDAACHQLRLVFSATQHRLAYDTFHEAFQVLFFKHAAEGDTTPVHLAFRSIVKDFRAGVLRGKDPTNPVEQQRAKLIATLRPLVMELQATTARVIMAHCIDILADYNVTDQQSHLFIPPRALDALKYELSCFGAALLNYTGDLT